MRPFDRYVLIVLVILWSLPLIFFLPIEDRTWTNDYGNGEICYSSFWNVAYWGHIKVAPLFTKEAQGDRHVFSLDTHWKYWFVFCGWLLLVTVLGVKQILHRVDHFLGRTLRFIFKHPATSVLSLGVLIFVFSDVFQKSEYPTLVRLLIAMFAFMGGFSLSQEEELNGKERNPQTTEFQ